MICDVFSTGSIPTLPLELGLVCDLIEIEVVMNAVKESTGSAIELSHGRSGAWRKLFF